MKIAVLPGDGIGPEIVAEALKVLGVFCSEGLELETETGDIGGIAVARKGNPLPTATLTLCNS
ncbi:MAG: 3-isopropylmalate dehydrogenase, partial [Ferrovum sp.]|nr:3-isopropylmalate dehydrogenase [Ferrovum sp.]